MSPWVSAPPVSVAPHNTYQECGRPSGTTSGDEFAVSWISGAVVKLTRLQTDLTPRDVPPLVLSSGGSPTYSDVACNGATCLVVWTELPGSAHARLVQDGVLGPPLSLGEAAAAGSDVVPQVVATGQGFAVVWNGPDDVESTAQGALVSNTGELVIKPLLAAGAQGPLLAYNGSSYLLVTYSGGKLWGRRLDQALTVVDQDGIELGAEPGVALSSHGQAFGLAFGASTTLRFRTIGPNLELGNVTEIANVQVDDFKHSDTPLARSGSGYVLFYRRVGSNSIFRSYRNDAGQWTTTKLAVATEGMLDAAMLSNSGVLLSCNRGGFYSDVDLNLLVARGTSGAGLVNGDVGVVAQVPAASQFRPVIRASKKRYLAAWVERGLWHDDRGLVARISPGGRLLDEHALGLGDHALQSMDDADVTDEAIFASGHRGTPLVLGAPPFLFIRPEQGPETGLQLPGGYMRIAKGADDVLVVSWDHDPTEYQEYRPRSTFAQRFSHGGEMVDASPIVLCSEAASPGTTCGLPDIAGAGGNYLLSHAGSSGRLALLHGDGTVEELASLDNDGALLANDSGFAFFTQEGNYTFTLQPVSTTGQIGAPNVVTVDSSYLVSEVFAEGDGYRALLRELATQTTATGRVAEGQIVDIEPLSDELISGSPVSAGPGAFAVVQQANGGFSVRLFARALPGGAACEASWQCASASCEADSCTNAGAGGAGGEPSGAGGEPSGAGGEPSGVGGEPSGVGGEPSGAGGEPSGAGGAPGPTVAAGGAGASTPSDGGAPLTDSGPAPGSGSSGCGCRAVGVAPTSSWLPLGLLLVVRRLVKRGRGRRVPTSFGGAR